MVTPGAGDTSLRALKSLCCDAIERARDPELRERLRGVLVQLERPLQLAVAGSTSAGKSTLVNAILRRHIGRVDAGDTTRVVTWFEYGGDDGRVTVELRSGRTVDLSLVDGMLPADLGAPVAEVLRLRVELDEQYLRDVTVIDTPGLNSVEPGEQATRALLFGDTAAEHAQALIYVMKHVQTADAAALDEFRVLSGACGMTAVDTAVILNKVDQHDSEQPDPWPRVAARLTARAEEQLRGRVLDVSPAVGLLADTARARRLRPADLAALTRLAALPVDDLDAELFEDGVTGFSTGVRVADVDASTAQRLVALLHRFGVLAATAHLREQPNADLDLLHEHLEHRSGFGPRSPSVSREGRPTPAHLLERFARNADQLKAFAGVGRIRRLVRAARSPRDIDLIIELRSSLDEHKPIMAGLSGLRILQACAALSRGQLRLDEQMTNELLTMARGASPAMRLGLDEDAPAEEIAEAARLATVRWRRLAGLTGPTVGGHRAHDVLRALEDIVAVHTRGADLSQSVAPRTSSTDHAPGMIPGAERELLAGLLESEALPGPEREIVARLMDARSAYGAVGLPVSASDADLRAAAVDVVGQLRIALHRPMSGSHRRAIRTACDAFEVIASTVPGRISQ